MWPVHEYAARKDGVRVTGFVPDVRTYFAKAHVAIATFSIAAGIQNKILEALAYGLPVVATSRTVQGLSKEVAAIVGIADTASDIAEEIIRLLSDPQSARRRGIEGRVRRSPKAIAGTARWISWSIYSNILLISQRTARTLSA